MTTSLCLVPPAPAFTYRSTEAPFANHAKVLPKFQMPVVFKAFRRIKVELQLAASVKLPPKPGDGVN